MSLSYLCLPVFFVVAFYSDFAFLRDFITVKKRLAFCYLNLLLERPSCTFWPILVSPWPPHLKIGKTLARLAKLRLQATYNVPLSLKYKVSLISCPFAFPSSPQHSSPAGNFSKLNTHLIFFKYTPNIRLDALSHAQLFHLCLSTVTSILINLWVTWTFSTLVWLQNHSRMDRCGFWTHFLFSWFHLTVATFPNQATSAELSDQIMVFHSF